MSARRPASQPRYGDHTHVEFLRSGIGNDVENGEGSILVVFERKEMSEISILN